MQWIYLLLAGFLEVGWTFGLKYSEGFTQLVPSIVTIVLLAVSFMLFARAMRTIEIGVAYAMFTGIGTVGTVIAGIFILNEPADFWRLFFIAILVGGIVGLKLVSKDKPAPADEQAEASSSIQERSTESAIRTNNKDREKVGT
ncbi:multidrug efflux SMR transporter [Bacillus sp. FJAT-26390]|uniref:DMT family transporter n=1 Tax=Bacillus sp. FJAT-26390 TaxID=1743142 RepID=UPI000807FDDE|nr:multidrug efflux SMR transporter [Bacillus sp. FJAT-26390]OBZ10032.1 ligand-binding protein SH3 [Bacillus sp. FJAT-26390]